LSRSCCDWIYHFIYRDLEGLKLGDALLESKVHQDGIHHFLFTLFNVFIVFIECFLGFFPRYRTIFEAWTGIALGASHALEVSRG
jgi:hypothetical protein